MNRRLLHILIAISFLQLASCSDTTSKSIEASLNNYLQKNNRGVASIQADSISYTLADSTIYYQHFLKSLEAKSEMYSRMARLKTNLAQSHLDDFLSGDKKDLHPAERKKLDVDKSLEELQQNERAWNAVNDSMDLMLNAVHTTDTLKKNFYDVSFRLLMNTEDKKLHYIRKAILNKDDLNVMAIVE